MRQKGQCSGWGKYVGSILGPGTAITQFRRLGVINNTSVFSHRRLDATVKVSAGLLSFVGSL
jgi:hypothetical protein